MALNHVLPDRFNFMAGRLSVLQSSSAMDILQKKNLKKYEGFHTLMSPVAGKKQLMSKTFAQTDFGLSYMEPFS